jgi:NAD+ kinase
MRRIGLVLKSSEKQALVLGEKISRFLKDNGKDVLLEPAYQDLAAQWDGTVTEHMPDEADLLVVLGGDGTMLRAASLLNSRSVPVLGVNLGRVGYMAEVSPHDAIPVLKSVLEGSSTFVERMMLEVTLPDGNKARALNDAVIHWGGIARLIDLGIRIGETKEIEMRADGLIVSTPIGSSAYSLAANGPLVHPDIEAIILTPICPYAGLKRPLLVPAHVATELVLRRGEDLILTLDGRKRLPLAAGQTLRIVRSELSFIMVKSKAKDYFEVLKEKLNLL